MQRMHAKRSSQIEAGKERNARRRKLTMAQQAASEAREQQNKLETLLEGLYKTSQEEQRIAERLEQVRKEETVLESNRALRLAQYNERREKDWAEALARETQLVASLKVLHTAPSLPNIEVRFAEVGKHLLGFR